MGKNYFWFKTSLIIFFALLSISLKAQVSLYSFSQSNGTYSPITGGAVVGTATSDDQRFVDPAVPAGGTTTTGVGLPIGFTFDYNGASFDRFAINNNGWISLGNSSLSPSVNINSSSSYNPISATSTAPADLQNRISVLGMDLQGQTGSEIRYETIGVSPNQVLVVQWKDYREYFSTGQTYNFQIRLYETSNIVEVVYGSFVNTASYTTQVGLRGTSNADFNNRNSPTDWSTTTTGTLNTNAVSLTSTVTPSPGLTFTWTPPAPAPMAFVSSTSTQTVTTSVTKNSTNNEIIGIQIVTSGNLSPFDVTSFTLNSNGSTDFLNDVSNVNIYYTGTSGVFAATNLFSTATSLASPLTGTQTLSPGTNYFWVTYDIPATATIGNFVDAEVTSIEMNGAGGTQTPSITSPAGSRKINYCVSSATSTADDDIGNVTFAGINNGSATPATNNPSSVNTYSDFTGIPAANVTKNQTYSISVSQINSGSFYTSWVNVFIDYNQDGLFDNTTERVFNAQTASGAGMTVSGSITIPPTALTGITGMRVVLRESGSATSPACGTYTWGETEDYLVNIAPQPALDLGVSALVNPATTGCYSSTETVRYRIMNYGSATVDFSVNPVTVYGSVTGVNPLTFTPLTISVGTLAPNATLDTAVSVTYDMSAAGSYTFDGYSSVTGDGSAINDAMSPVSIDINAGTASTTSSTLCGGSSTSLTLTGYNGTIQWQSSTDGSTWVNETGTGNTSATYSVSPSDTIQYRALICGAHPSNAVTINVIVPSAPIVTDATRCGMGTVTLGASGSGTLNWYTAPTGGTLVNTGTSYSPFVNNTTSFYVENVMPGGTEYGGRPSPTSTTGFLFNGYGVRFNITQATTLNSVTLYPVGTGTVTLSLLSSTNAVLATTPAIAVTGSGISTPVVVPLGFSVPVGTDYKLVLTSYTGITDLLRDFTNTFPYNSPSGALSVVGGWTGSTSTAYYFMYNININGNCSSSRSVVTATVTPADTIIAAAADPNICQGSSTNISVTSTNAGYSYSWTPASGLNMSTGSTVIASPSSTTTYTITATDASNCQTATTVGVSVTTMPAINAISGRDSVCFGDTTQLNILNGEAQQYIYVGTGTTSNTSSGYPAPFGNFYYGARHQMLYTAAELTAAGLVAGPVNSLALNVTNTNGADPLTGFEIKMMHSSLTALTTFQTGLTVVSPAANYNPVTGWNDFTFTTPFIWDGVSNIIVETCFNNTNWTDNASTTRTTTPFTSTVYYREDASGVCSNPGVTGTSSLRPNIRLTRMNNFSYSWSPAGSLTNAAIINPIANPAVTTSYAVTLTDLNSGCSVSDTVTVVVSPLPVVDLGNDTSICADANIVLDAGPGATNYNWSTGASSQTITVSSAGAYYVEKTNIYGCSVADTINIGINPLPVVNLGTDTTRCGGSVTLDAGNPGSSYAWNGVSGSQQFTVSASGVYIAEVTSAFGCVNSDTINVTINPIPVIGLRNDTAICFGTSIILDANNAGSSFDWSTGEITQTITVDTAGTYYVEVTSPQGCVNVDTFNLVINPLPVVSLGADTTFCLADSLVLDPGVGYTSYLWNDGSVNQTLTIGASGSYHVTVSNGFNCYNTDTINVVANPLPVTDAGADQTICEGQGVQLTSTGGPTFIWNNGSTTPSIFVTPTDTTMYIVTSTNNLQCSTTDTVMVFVNPLPVVDAGADQAFCGSVGTVQLIATGADSYLWSNGLTNDTISVAPLGSTTYVVTGTDLNGCSASDNVLVDVNPLPVVSAGADQSVCSGNPVLLTASGANTYVWSTGDNTASIVVSPVVATSYIVTGTDINGCMNSDTVTVNVNSAPVVSINPVAPVCAGSSVTLTANGASSYVWNNGVMTQTNTVSPTVTTTYAVIGTTNGCSAADSITVVVNYAPVADFSGTASANTYSFVNQSTGATSYSWNFGDGSPVDNGTNPSHTYTANGGYAVTLIATNSCGSDTMSMMVSVSGIGIEESDMSKTLAIFPNPTKGEFTLTFNSSSVTKANILLMSVEGRLINLDKNVSVNGAFKQTYHIENLAKGIYMLQIITDEGVITKRITLN